MTNQLKLFNGKTLMRFREPLWNFISLDFSLFEHPEHYERLYGQFRELPKYQFAEFLRELERVLSNDCDFKCISSPVKRISETPKKGYGPNGGRFVYNITQDTDSYFAEILNKDIYTSASFPELAVIVQSRFVVHRVWDRGSGSPMTPSIRFEYNKGTSVSTTRVTQGMSPLLIQRVFSLFRGFPERRDFERKLVEKIKPLFHSYRDSHLICPLDREL
jgi:hypothetical protein